MKIITTFILALVLIGCTNQEPQQEPEKAIEPVAVQESTVIRNFAVIWEWSTEDFSEITKYLKEQTEELDVLFEKGIVENVYINNYEIAEVNKDVKMMSIMFFVKAKDEANAKAILNELLFVKKTIAKYRFYPVGKKWLGRLESADNDKKFSFAIVWSHNNDKEMIEKNVKTQFDQTAKLWSEGSLENAYFSLEDAYEQKSETPGMVYFINADNEADARALIDSTLFVKKNIATYQLFPVGTFYLGVK